ncbi:hypothetical protein BGX26_010775 [Mortierella sp. AD094]|nr:hypothetical protein BGX26_010775 [Mortierella sp. AD094]
MTVTSLNSLDEFHALVKSGKPAVIDFWATWCGPCRVISPVFETLSHENPGVEFYKVDVDEQSEIAQEVGVRAMPTFISFKNGDKVSDVVGANPASLKVLVAGVASA